MKKIFSIILFAISVSIFGQIPNYVPTSGLNAWWSFTGNAHDDSGNGNDGIPVDVVLTTDRFGNNNCAYLFNGTSSHISIKNPFFDNGLSAWTISCWINSSSTNNSNNNNNNQCVYNTIPHNGLALSFNWGNSNQYAIWANSNPSNANWDLILNGKSTSSISINNWNHLVVVKSNTTYSFYLNGILDQTITTSSNTSSYLCKMIIGSTDSTVVEETFIGKIDDFGVWNRALTSNEITGLFNAVDGVNEIQKEDAFSIYPNPASEKLWINNNSKTIEYLNNTFSVEISSITGQIFKKINCSGKDLLNGLNISDLKNGIYFIDIHNNNIQTHQKFIKTEP